MVNALARTPRSLAALLAGALLMVVLAGCAIKHPTANVVAGKQLFVSKCGSCHMLSHAATAGAIGPNLDDAFRQDRADGINDAAIQGMVDFWIRYPDTQGVMPAMLYQGQSAQDVAAYVGQVAGRSGQDTGALASAGAVSGTTAADGKVIFNGVGGCGGCHVLSAAGSAGRVGPNLDVRLRSDCQTAQSKAIRGATLDKCIYSAITNPYAYLPAGYPSGVMPATFKRTLKANELQALVNFISTAAK